MAHRRIRIIGQVVVDPKELQPETEAAPQQQNDKRNNRRRRRNNNNKSKDEATEQTAAAGDTETVDDTVKPAAEEETVKPESGDSAEPAFEPVPVLMIETENIKAIKFAMTTEVKVFDWIFCVSFWCFSGLLKFCHLICRP